MLAPVLLSSKIVPCSSQTGSFQALCMLSASVTRHNKLLFQCLADYCVPSNKKKDGIKKKKSALFQSLKLSQNITITVHTVISLQRGIGASALTRREVFSITGLRCRPNHMLDCSSTVAELLLQWYSFLKHPSLGQDSVTEVVCCVLPLW